MSDQVSNLESEFTLLRSQFMGMPKRAAKRYRCRLATLGYLTDPSTGEKHEVWPSNASDLGIGFVMTRPLEVGIDVTITFPRQQGGHFTIEARIVHSSCTNQDQWLIGCALTQKLAADLLEELF